MCLYFFFIMLLNYKKTKKQKKQKNACLYLFQGSFYNETAKE
jgi:hypothetical protein